MAFQLECLALLSCFHLTREFNDATNEKLLTHFEGGRIDVPNQETKIFVDAALINQVKFFVTLFQQGNDHINNCNVLAKNNAIINIPKNNAVLAKEDAFINLTLNEVMSDEPFEILLKPIVSSLLKAIQAIFKFENVFVLVSIRDINWNHPCRKLHVNRCVQICLRECKYKVNAL
jgi:hypothetical protein